MSIYGIEQDLADGYCYTFNHPDVDQTITVGHLPARRLPCVYTQKGTVIRTLGRFTSVREAAEFVDVMNRLMAARAGGVRA